MTSSGRRSLTHGDDDEEQHFRVYFPAVPVYSLERINSPPLYEPSLTGSTSASAKLAPTANRPYPAFFL